MSASNSHFYDAFPKGPIVQKYGGTSVGSAERVNAVADRIVKLHHGGYQKLAIVVSARAGETNRLIDMVLEISPNPPPKAYDLAVAAGEQVSVALLSAALEERGLQAAPFLAYQLGIRTDHAHSQARIIEINTAPISTAWDQGKVAVVAGFQGITDALEITTLGRGGSDTSAVAMAVALKASVCEINTDVDGVFSADPRVVPNAKLIDQLDFETALEMASLGSKVLHPRCVELGAKYKLPIIVRNSFKSEETRRTSIMPLQQEPIESPIVSGVSVDRQVSKLTITKLPTNSKVISTIFAALGKIGVNVDIIIHQIGLEGKMQVGFTVNASDSAASCKEIERLLATDQFSGASYTHESDLAKVSVVGMGMRSHSGVASKTFTALSNASINIHMISTSEIKISCVVSGSDADSAARALHADFIDDN